MPKRTHKKLNQNPQTNPNLAPIPACQAPGEGIREKAVLFLASC
jgi:hypothetical protein